MPVGKYFKADYGDTAVEDRMSQIGAIFDAYDAHHDEFCVQNDLNNKFSEYAGLGLYHQTFLRLAIGYCVRELMAPNNMLRQVDAHDSDECRNALRLILKAASPYPELMQGISTELSKMIVDIKANEVTCRHAVLPKMFGFEELSQYSALSTGVSEYVIAILEHSDSIAMEYFPDIATQLDGTPYLSLIQAGHVQAYLDHYVCTRGMDNGNISKNFLTMKNIPSVWKKMEELADDVFFAYAPEFDIQNDEVTAGAHYCLEYNRELACLSIVFNTIVETNFQRGINTKWIKDELVEDAQLQRSYVVINHALGVLNGTRDGATTLNKAWIEHQRQYLAPVMEADIQEMTSEFARRGLPLPKMPDIKPVAGQGQSSGFSVAAHDSFRII